MPCTTSRTDRFEPAVDSAKSRSSRSDSSASHALSAALPAILSPVKPGVAEVSTSARTKPLPTRRVLATSLISSDRLGLVLRDRLVLGGPAASTSLAAALLETLPRLLAQLLVGLACSCPSRPCPWRHPARTAPGATGCEVTDRAGVPSRRRYWPHAPARSRPLRRARPDRPRHGRPLRRLCRAAGAAGCAATWSRPSTGPRPGADGRSGSINNDADHVVFEVLRALSHVVVVGAGTIRAEGYPPLSVDDSLVGAPA